MGKWLRIPLTLLGHGKGQVGGENTLLNCCKWLQINGTFFTVRALGSAWKEQLANRKERKDRKEEDLGKG
jgi:hypothetical protein